MPKHYHAPEDTPATLDLPRLATSIDFAEMLTRVITARRLDRH